ncbi:Tryptophanase [Enhygromyxa salina]|uniref:Tryptophanase n=1 Tax=Enhygromyxa salina TaxID=215803 RepID=A0A0C2CRW0_9BACT|nr:tryptophanase [Enhygromyxa salina]KIG13926.1 Tryptophanase [Enhygromyxa salina]
MAAKTDQDPYLDTLAEPFRIKTVERIRLPTRAEREEILKRAFYSVMYLDSADVFVDLGTDSGTGAMSDEQWAALMRGDEAYVRSRSFFTLEKTVQDITGFPHVVPTHQGRAAENIMMNLLLKPGDMVLCNAHFDTTRAHVQHHQAVPVDLVGDWLWEYDEELPFKGNFDLERLAVALERYHSRVPFILITILNNFACSSPVSMANIKAVKALADQYSKPIYFDACRMSENAYFIKTREPGYENTSVTDIVREMLSYGSGCWMSAKKDAIVNIGGFLAVRDEDLARKCQEQLVLYEGFPTYGGLARRDLEAMAVGLREGLDEDYLSHRVRSVAHLGDLLSSEAGVVVSKPVGGSGVFVDVASLYPHLTPEQFPGIALACDLYLEGAIRVGAITFHMNRVVPATGDIVEKVFQFARFAVPRRLYTRSHLEYTAKVMAKVKDRAPANQGYRAVYVPEVLGHFFAKFEPLG